MTTELFTLILIQILLSTRIKCTKKNTKTNWTAFAYFSVLKFLNNLWRAMNRVGRGVVGGLPGYIDWRNRFFGIDPGLPKSLKIPSLCAGTFCLDIKLSNYKQIYDGLYKARIRFRISAFNINPASRSLRKYTRIRKTKFLLLFLSSEPLDYR